MPQSTACKMNNRVAYLISKKLSEEINTSETQELNEWLASSPSLYETISLLEIAWKNDQDQETENAGKVQKLLYQLRLEEEINLKTESTGLALPTNKVPFMVSFKLYARWVAAAVFIGLLFFTFPKLFKPSIKEKHDVAETENKIETKAGNRTKVILYDGTAVWLNGESKLTILKPKEATTREVFLLGEAYFEVNANLSKPFIIHTENTRVKVTGTSLNVRDYPGEDKAETSLMTGKAEVFAIVNPSNIVRLQPNQKAVFRHVETNHGKISPALSANKMTDFATEVLPIVYYPLDSIPVEKAWINDQLTFFNEPFREVANKMEKWYGVKIQFESNHLEQERLNGKFTNESLKDALDALQFILKFNYSIKNQTIIIKPK
jgi:ferric-dicitrate binding protein FerR (iron transport regulator)